MKLKFIQFYNIPISTRKKPTGKLFKNALYHAVLFCSVLINVFTICLLFPLSKYKLDVVASLNILF